MGKNKTNVEKLTKKEREAKPVPFDELLLRALEVKPSKKKGRK